MRNVHAGTPIRVGATTIVPLEQIKLHCRSGRNVFFFCASKEPVGLVINSPLGRWAINLDGERVPLETFSQEVDGLQQVLEGIQDNTSS